MKVSVRYYAVALTCLFFLIVSIKVHCLLTPLQELEEHDFAVSFLNNYDFSSQSRYSREYHSFILGKARESLLLLENHIIAQGFSVDGRIVICGYQEDAIPSYVTSHDEAIIDDEQSVKTAAGWKSPPGALCGFLTGFILKDVNKLFKKGYAVFEHVVPERIGLFDDYAEIFHYHAFGKAFDTVMRAKKQCVKALLGHDYKKTLSLLYDFWKNAYTKGLVDGSKRLIATQDILFSLQYMRHLLDSSLPLHSFFVGPDITYPIEQVRCQKKEATVGAQAFLKRFESCLQPVNNKKTAYIFCSFVDGVGKSTLLGNIKNKIRYGNAFDCYERVDNSSSQHAELFHVSEKVVIVDLPAQMSHFVIKPEGSVFVDIDTVKEIDEDEKQNVSAYVKQHKKYCIQKFNDAFTLCEKKEDDCLDPEIIYLKNVLLFQHESMSGVWIPFFYHNNHFIFNREQPENIRMLVPLNNVHSYGLKVVEPEQMLFTGLSIPTRYDHFLTDVTDQLHAAGVSNVVFVDFMSMYPRSSRETVRINFLLQQLKMNCGDCYSIDNSLLRHLVNQQELYSLLKNKKKDVACSLLFETTMRWSLQEMVVECQNNGLKSVSGAALQSMVHDAFTTLYNEHYEYLFDLVTEKIKTEYAAIQKAYECDKDFASIVCFDFESLAAFSTFIQRLFSKEVRNPYFNALWADLDGQIVPDNTDDSAVLKKQHNNSKIRFLDNGLPVEVLYTFDRACRDKCALNEFFSVIRAQWYAALSNILTWQKRDGRWQVSDVVVAVPPLHIILDEKYCYCIRPLLERIFHSDEKLPALFFDGTRDWDNEQRQWASFKKKAHCLDWNHIPTRCGVYSFGYNASGCSSSMQKIINFAVEQCKKNLMDSGRDNCFVPTSMLLPILQQQGLLQSPAKKSVLQKKEKINYEAAQLFVRAIATLDMIIKDPMADIMVRKENKEDFIAALRLLEHVLLPSYWEVVLDKPLFNKYIIVEPIISWDFFTA